MTRPVSALAALLLAACTGGGGTPPPPTPVAQPAPGPQPYRKPASAPVTVAPMPRPMPAAPRAQSGALRWHSSIAQAQADARAQGKLILVGSTKPECSMCDKFQHEIAPACGSRLSQVAVCYMYDITRPEDVRVDRALRSNLPGEFMMPLVGFMTADLGWVHGFGGSRTAGEFMNDIEIAARSRGMRAAAAPAHVDGPAVAFVNEFGEQEWSAPADVWPAPVDALGPVPALATAPTAPPPAAGSTAAELDAVAAAALAAPAPSISPEPAVVAAAPEPEAPAGAVSSSEQPVPSLAAAPDPGPMPSVEPMPAPAQAATRAGMSELQGRVALDEAAVLIRAGRFDEARGLLRQVSDALSGTAVGREAAKGTIALYNARRIAQADAAARSTLAAQARRDLGGTLWASLF